MYVSSLFLLQRPRKVGARFTGSDIAPDEHVQPNLAFDYDGKRDRWNGYNMEDHTQIAEEFQKVDEVRKKIHACMALTILAISLIKVNIGNYLEEGCSTQCIQQLSFKYFMNLCTIIVLPSRGSRCRLTH